ncbi:Aminopeptidase N [Gammaproteobacteria bacterium]
MYYTSQHTKDQSKIMQTKITYLRDYAPPTYRIETIHLKFDLEEDRTIVHSRLGLKRQVPKPTPLILDGQNLTLLSLVINGRVLTEKEYSVGEESLTIDHVPEIFTLEVKTAIQPKENTALEGLYASSGNLCTQCEPEGFRRITYYLDRPDVMAMFTVTLEADRTRYPVLLSNGNPAEKGELPGGRHYARWVDPFPKPSYLFALVAGDLACLSSHYVTTSGRNIDLRIYVQHQNRDQCEHALASLKKAMRWDEEVYGREYDLDVYQIVAVDDFNMGAMENKGLNIFNSRYVLAHPESATDDDFEGVEAVIAHEYFHNWSGNRVTCRDWFQLSLKEGFTVFRDQEFTADMTSRAVKRIKDAQRLRTAQFREDAGPLAHPVRPEAYVEINNFYTVTIYEKGAEVVRMARNLLGAETFRRATDLYFSRHDGQAVTTDDFVQALIDVSGRDLSQFQRWYSQAGTPILKCHGEYDPKGHAYTLTIDQSCQPTPGQPEKNPFHIPFAVGLLNAKGYDLSLRLSGELATTPMTTRVLEIRKSREVFQFLDVLEPPIPSFLRGFSAPVLIEAEYSDADLAFLMAQDSDLFNRWDAGQQWMVRLIKGLLQDYAAGQILKMPPLLVQSVGKLLEKWLETPDAEDRRLLAEAISLPSEAYLAQRIDPIDPKAIHEVRKFLRISLARSLRTSFLAVQKTNTASSSEMTAEAIGKRRLKNVSLGYLMELEDDEIYALCTSQFQNTTNMTDAMAALGFLTNSNCQERLPALARFYGRWRGNALVVDKWFSLQATSRLPNTLESVKGLLHHPDFRHTNPNKVRALIGAFCHANPLNFHAPDGSGYEFLSEQVLGLDSINPQVASRLISAMSDWRRYEPNRREKMRETLEEISRASLSKDTYEIVNKSL